jgi:hypothetical protein
MLFLTESYSCFDPSAVCCDDRLLILANRGLAFAMLASSSGGLRAPLSSSEILSFASSSMVCIFLRHSHHRSLYTIVVRKMTLIITQIYSPK